MSYLLRYNEKVERKGKKNDPSASRSSAETSSSRRPQPFSPYGMEEHPEPAAFVSTSSAQEGPSSTTDHNGGMSNKYGKESARVKRRLQKKQRQADALATRTTKQPDLRLAPPSSEQDLYRHRRPRRDFEGSEEYLQDEESVDSSLQPGAVAIAQRHAANSRSRDTTSMLSFVSGPTNTIHDGEADIDGDSPQEPIIATLVGEEDQQDGSAVGSKQVPLVVATQDKRGTINWRDRKVQFCLGLVMVLVVALAIGLGVSLANRNDRLVIETASPTATPTATLVPSGSPSTLPTAAPTMLEWIQIGQNITAKESFQNFGSAVAISTDGSQLAIGTPQTTNSGSNGNVYIFQEDILEFWSILSYPIEGDAAGDQVGRAVSLSSTEEDGLRVAIGYPFFDKVDSASVLEDVGMVRVFEYSVTLRDYVQLGQDLVGTIPSAYYGYSVSLSNDGRHLAVANSQGNVQIYRYTGEDGETPTMMWILVGPPVETADESGITCSSFQGASVALMANGKRVVIVDYGDEDVTVGYFRVYDFDDRSETWTQVGSTQKGGSHDTDQPYEYFGSSLSLSDDGSVVAVAGLRAGISNWEGGGGFVYAFFLDEELGDWRWSGRMEPQDDQFLVRTVSLSGDGRRLAVQDHLGEVRIFDYDEKQEIWRQVENGLVAAGVPDFRFDGETVALSSDGNTVVIGAPELGIVRVFRLQSI